MRDPIKSRFDNVLFGFFTRSWDAAKFEAYPRTLESHVKTSDGLVADAFQMIDTKAVSYTHLTLPTNREV